MKHQWTKLEMDWARTKELKNAQTHVFLYKKMEIDL